MVPECSCLVGNLELVQERMARRDRALVDSDWTVRPCRAFLEETVPVLEDIKSEQVISM